MHVVFPLVPVIPISFNFFEGFSKKLQDIDVNKADVSLVFMIVESDKSGILFCTTKILQPLSCAC